MSDHDKQDDAEDIEEEEPPPENQPMDDSEAQETARKQPPTEPDHEEANGAKKARTFGPSGTIWRGWRKQKTRSCLRAISWHARRKGVQKLWAATHNLAGDKKWDLQEGHGRRMEVTAQRLRRPRVPLQRRLLLRHRHRDQGGAKSRMTVIVKTFHKHDLMRLLRLDTKNNVIINWDKIEALEDTLYEMHRGLQKLREEANISFTFMGGDMNCIGRRESATRASPQATAATSSRRRWCERSSGCRAPTRR